MYMQGTTNGKNYINLLFVLVTCISSQDYVLQMNI